MKIVFPLIAAVTLAGTGALAQQQPSTPPQGNSQQNPQQQNGQQLTPQQFVQNAESGNDYEIGASQIAVRKTQDPKIRRFAYLMVRDHSRIGAALEITIAADRNVDLPADTPLASEQKQNIDALNSATGADFDNTYVPQMVDFHRQALLLFENYARDGSDARLKTFARRTVPIVRDHLLMAERLQPMESRMSTPTTTGRSSSQGGAGGKPPAKGGQAAPSPPAGSDSGGAGKQEPAPTAH